MTDNAPRNKAIVREFLTKTFSDRDFTALERWLSPDYIQHNPFIPAKRAGLRALVEKYPEGRHYEPGMIIIAEGELVMAHGRRSEEHTSELQSRLHLVCRLLLEKIEPCWVRRCTPALEGKRARQRLGVLYPLGRGV